MHEVVQGLLHTAVRVITRELRFVSLHEAFAQCELVMLRHFALLLSLNIQHVRRRHTATGASARSNLEHNTRRIRL